MKQYRVMGHEDLGNGNRRSSFKAHGNLWRCMIGAALALLRGADRVSISELNGKP